MTIDIPAVALALLILIYAIGVVSVILLTIKEYVIAKQEDRHAFRTIWGHSPLWFLWLIFGWPIWLTAEAINEVIGRAK